MDAAEDEHDDLDNDDVQSSPFDSASRVSLSQKSISYDFSHQSHNYYDDSKIACRGETSLEPDTGFATRSGAGEAFLRPGIEEDSGMPTVENVFFTPKQNAELTQNIFLVNTKPTVMLPKVAEGNVFMTPTPHHEAESTPSNLNKNEEAEAVVPAHGIKNIKVRKKFNVNPGANKRNLAGTRFAPDT